MIKCAVLGFPISHSLSPRLHRAAYQALGVDGSYGALEMPEDDFEAFFQSAKQNGWTGFSLTMPLKERLNTSGIVVDSVASRINSVNTLYLRDGVWLGTSTDYLGFKRIFSGLNFTSVCVVGGGATARAALAALDGTVDEISVALRNPAKFADLEQSTISSRLKLVPFNVDVKSVDLVVSTVPSGASDVLAKDLKQVGGTLFDVLYNPWPTQLASAWHTLGGPVINGFDLLVEQALDQVALMTGKSFDLDLIRGVMNKAIVVERGRSPF